MSKKTGFTIIELLTVIAIIAIMVAITEPLLNISSSRTHELECESHLRQLGVAMNAYAQDNGCFPARLGQIDPLLQDKSMLDCPGTCRQYFYVQPGPDADRDTVIASCVDPKTSPRRLPHRLCSAYLSLTAGGGVNRVIR